MDRAIFTIGKLGIVLAAALAAACAGSGSDDPEDLGFQCCAYERRTSSSYSSGTWSQTCSCANQSCAEVTGGQDCSGGGCVTTEVRNVREVESCEAILAQPECSAGESRCVPGNKYQTCRSGKWSSEKSCYTACYPSDGWCSGGSCQCD